MAWSNSSAPWLRIARYQHCFRRIRRSFARLLPRWVSRRRSVRRRCVFRRVPAHVVHRVASETGCASSWLGQDRSFRSPRPLPWLETCAVPSQRRQVGIHTPSPRCPSRARTQAVCSLLLPAHQRRALVSPVDDGGSQRGSAWAVDLPRPQLRCVSSWILAWETHLRRVPRSSGFACASRHPPSVSPWLETRTRAIRTRRETPSLARKRLQRTRVRRQMAHIRDGDVRDSHMLQGR
mmetsp:Transcript_6391/g.39867  ORF Transcript_6391/g.39867 Transcript_6391/m.39867 type:complete len:236 (-) Transcript_6391:14-721(-)